jgi:hypothetical protein
MAGGEEFAGFKVDFAGVCDWLGLPNTSDPVALAMQYAANASTEKMSATRRLAVARAMRDYFNEMEATAAAQLGAAAAEGG